MIASDPVHLRIVRFVVPGTGEQKLASQDNGTTVGTPRQLESPKLVCVVEMLAPKATQGFRRVLEVGDSVTHELIRKPTTLTKDALAQSEAVKVDVSKKPFAPVSGGTVTVAGQDVRMLF